MTMRKIVRNISKCFSHIVSNWRLKVKLIGVGILLLVILKQHFDIQSLHNQNMAIRVETRTASDAIHSVSEKLKAGNHSEPNLSRAILAFDNAALLLGQPPGDGGHGQDRAIVCPERHLGGDGIDWPYYMKNWVLEDCDYGRKVGDIVTLVFSVDREDQVSLIILLVFIQFLRPVFIVFLTHSLHTMFHNVFCHSDDTAFMISSGFVHFTYFVPSDIVNIELPNSVNICFA